MTDKIKPSNEGYRPDRIEKGYQPTKQPPTQGDPKPQGGYQPTTSEGDNPSNNPPGRE